jgi:hypothetical protein
MGASTRDSGAAAQALGAAAAQVRTAGSRREGGGQERDELASARARPPLQAPDACGRSWIIGHVGKTGQLGVRFK